MTQTKTNKEEVAGEGWRVKVRKWREERKQLGERGRRPPSCSFFSRVFLRLTSTFHLPGTFKHTCACVETSEAGIKSDCQMYLLLAFFGVCPSVCPSVRLPQPAFEDGTPNLRFMCRTLSYLAIQPRLWSQRPAIEAPPCFKN